MTDAEVNQLKRIGGCLEDLREHVAGIKGEIKEIEERIDEQLNSLADLVSPGWGRGRLRP